MTLREAAEWAVRCWEQQGDLLGRAMNCVRAALEAEAAEPEPGEAGGGGIDFLTIRNESLVRMLDERDALRAELAAMKERAEAAAGRAAALAGVAEHTRRYATVALAKLIGELQAIAYADSLEKVRLFEKAAFNSAKLIGDYLADLREAARPEEQQS